MSAIPADWMPRCKMDRIIVHWTGGPWSPTGLDRRHYHIIVDNVGALHRGICSIADNVNTRDSRYAAHTLGCNQGSIGLALSAMAGATERPLRFGPSPITKTQWDAAIRAIADLARFYGIQPVRTRILTHAEVQESLNIRQRGKWDIAVLPFDPSFNTAAEVGGRMRSEVANLI